MWDLQGVSPEARAVTVQCQTVLRDAQDNRGLDAHDEGGAILAYISDEMKGELW